MYSKDDSISRQGVIKTINKVRGVCDTESLDDYRDLLVECFEVMPSAQPSFPQRHENDHIAEVGKMDCISRQAAIDAVSRGCQEWRGIFAECKKNLNELPPAQPEQRWIPVTERLPAYGEDVLISIGGYCNVGHIVSVNEEEQYNWYFSGWYHLPNDVDAWMPLPEPYQKGVGE